MSRYDVEDCVRVGTAHDCPHRGCRFHTAETVGRNLLRLLPSKLGACALLVAEVAAERGGGLTQDEMAKAFRLRSRQAIDQIEQPALRRLAAFGALLGEA